MLKGIHTQSFVSNFPNKLNIALDALDSGTYIGERRGGPCPPCERVLCGPDPGTPDLTHGMGAWDPLSSEKAVHSDFVFSNRAHGRKEKSPPADEGLPDMGGHVSFSMRVANT